MVVANGNKEMDLKQFAHVIVTNVGWLKNLLGGRKPFDISHLQLMIFDEADEIFNQQSNHGNIGTFYKKFETAKIKP